MFTTTVEFSVNAPVLGIGSDVSPALDALVARWQDDPVVAGVAVKWMALPRAGENLFGAAKVRVDLQADTKLALRKAYDRLTLQVTRNGKFRLSGRGCVLMDMFG
jgi:hypothetical protein